jgi:hypothetical protein
VPSPAALTIDLFWKKFPKGGSEAFLLRASDNRPYAVKFIENTWVAVTDRQCDNDVVHSVDSELRFASNCRYSRGATAPLDVRPLRPRTPTIRVDCRLAVSGVAWSLEVWVARS